MKLFGRDTSSLETLQPDLIFLHIRKTAGTSFVDVLKQVYKTRNVNSLHIEQVGDDDEWRITFNNKRIEADNKLQLGDKVLYGHFPYAAYKRFFSPSEKVPIITWLRRPVKRVRSAYHYASQIYHAELSEKHPRFNILNSLKRDLLEYASIEAHQNQMSKMLAGIELEQLYFVGIVEHFEEDMAYLAKKLGWGNYTIPHVNRTAPRPPLPPFKRKAIKAWNQADEELYERALELRSRRK